MKQLLPRIFPAIQKYFDELDLKDVSAENLSALESLRYGIGLNEQDKQWNIVFYSANDSLLTLAAHVFFQTLTYKNKIKKTSVYSTVGEASNIDIRLLPYLESIGYRIKKTENNGKAAYEITYSEKADPILLFAQAPAVINLTPTRTTAVAICKTQDCKMSTTIAAEDSFKLKFQSSRSDDTSMTNSLKEVATNIMYILK